MKQLNLFYPLKVDLDGRIDCKGRVTYVGEFTFEDDDGHYRGLARVGNELAFVEVRLTLEPRHVKCCGRL